MSSSRDKISKLDKKAAQSILDELFFDYANQARRIYKINFIRGIFFGFGSVLGGTILIALLLWLLSLIGALVPFLSEVTEHLSELLNK